jgi:ABC-2 type transport system permease protein
MVKGFNFSSKTKSVTSILSILWFFTRLSFHKKYSKLKLGLIWAVLEPVLLAVLLWVVFSFFLKERSFGLDPYFLFIITGILPWWWFASSLSSSSKFVKQNTKELKLSVLPLKLFPAVPVLVAFIEFLFTLPILLIAVIFSGLYPSWFFFMFFIGIILQFILLYGCSLLITCLSAMLPDTVKIVKIVSRMLFYLSPIIYSLSNVPNFVQPFVSLNPLTGIFSLYRFPFWGEVGFSLLPLILATIVSVFIFILGFLVFSRKENLILKKLDS